MRWPSLDDQVAHRLRVVASHIGICSRWPSGLSIGSSVIRCREDLVVSCRICGVGCDGGPMLCPCRCSGSIKYVHIDCLNRWRAAKLNPLNELRCEICHADFRYVHVDRDGNAKQELRRPAPGDIRMLVLKRLAVWHMLFLAAAVGIGLLSKLLAPSFGGAGSRVLGSAEAARGHGKGLVPEWLECGIFSMLGICTLLSVGATAAIMPSSSARWLRVCFVPRHRSVAYRQHLRRHGALLGQRDHDSAAHGGDGQGGGRVSSSIPEAEDPTRVR
mmetsp:Transcript_111029/g.358150  ORF Transcript_111029/g.358150 Transcript_111029/m.358150 type:complete len:273 (-) Transcript_111029:299-1117(-)